MAFSLYACNNRGEPARTVPQPSPAVLEKPSVPQNVAAQPAPGVPETPAPVTPSPPPPAAANPTNPVIPQIAEKTSQFVVSDMKIAPIDMRVGDLATVTVTVTNTGSAKATYDAVLKVLSGRPEADMLILPQARQSVTLAAGESTVVTFQVGVATSGGNNGAIVVGIENQTGKFNVDSQG